VLLTVPTDKSSDHSAMAATGHKLPCAPLGRAAIEHDRPLSGDTGDRLLIDPWRDRGLLSQ
jgi:hypothetical protein